MTMQALVPQSTGQAYAPAIQEQALTAETLKRQVEIVRTAQRAVMKPGHHYDKIPGCGDKPVLLKPGAEVVALTFQFATEYQVVQTDLGNGHREYEVTCTLIHRPTGGYVGQGIGSCSTMESKWRFRKAEQVCPECGKETIIKGKKEYGGGWVCYTKKGGCGAKFNDGDPDIENQNMGRIEHDNPADYYNTCLKMAKKRAFVDAILTSTAASDVFTQDLEEQPEAYGGKPGPQRVNLDSVKAAFNACMTVEQLTQTLQDLNLDKKHPDAKAVAGIYNEVKGLIESSSSSENF